MANLLLDIIRSLAAGAIGDKIKEEASPYVEDVMRPAPPEKPMTEGYRYDDRGFPTRSSMIPAQTSGYVRPRADGVRGEAADPYVVDQMMREAIGEQRTREGELAQAMADEAAQKRASVLDFVRQAGQGTGTAQTAPYTPSDDSSAMFSSPNVQRMMMNPRIQATSAKIAQEAPELTPKQNLAATALEEVKKEGMLRKAQRAAGAPVQEGSTDMALGMYPNGKPDESSSFFDEIAGGLKDLFGTREGWMAIGAAANELRFKPSDSYRASDAKILERREARRGANATIEALRAKGIDEATLQAIAKNPELLKAVATKVLTKGYADTSAEQTFFESLYSDMTPEDIEKAKRIKLGLDPRADSTLNLSLEDLLARAAAQAQGSKAGTIQAEAEEQARKNANALGIWEYSIGNLKNSLADTTTGVFAGWLPAFTTNAALADQAIAQMGPTLKTVFREAGEGTFTEGDQKLLNDMIPNRSMPSGAIAQALESINTLVMLKLRDPSRTIEEILKENEQLRVMRNTSPATTGGSQAGADQLEIIN